ncbi:uncharacterized protein LOC131935934 [Physella acuta]|uniref:uncharacterized protein LOC131935934 n=1 Tax=Physella acuta TaxID=109671 RepID=UPI0027DE6982|nr:uncharacterized protein LOC131935934 [Physella acuta]
MLYSPIKSFTKSHRQTPTLLPALLLLMVFHVVESNSHKSRLCARVDDLNLGVDNVAADNKGLTMKRFTMDCKDTQSMVGIEVHKLGKHYQATILTCPRVIKVLVHAAAPGYFKTDSPIRRTLSCDRGQDTMLVLHPSRHQTVTVASRDHTGLDQLRLAWSYQYVTALNTTEWAGRGFLSAGPGQALQVSDLSSRRSPREKRSTSDTQESPKPKTCGKDYSCVRFGRESCRHMECEYLLTYSITNLTYLVLEISAKASGWVALGLSSDDKMGGDGAIVCKRKSPLDRGLEAVSMWINLPHTRPNTRSSEDYTLAAQNLTDGYIYCKMTRVLPETDTDADNTLDLSNNWYQFYARGEIDSNGLILKHDDRPPTSLHSITMLRHNHIHSHRYTQLTDQAQTLHIGISTSLTLLVLHLVISWV